MPASAVYEGLGELGIEAEQIPCEAAPFPIWLLAAQRPPPTRAWRLLSVREQQRAMRFVNPKSRERYVAAHAALRILIEAYFGLASYRQAFSTTPLGKPQLAGYPDIQCSLSYSGDHALLGVAPGAEIGLDIEQIRTITDAEDLASVYFTEREKSFLQANSPDSPAFHRDFLRIWTRKEACLKAVGQGLNGFNTIECAPGEMTTPVRIGQSQVHAGAIAMRNYAASWARATPLISF